MDIAIIGMGCLFPGYTDKKMFWDSLMTGRSMLKQEIFRGRLIDRGAIPLSGKDFFADKFPADELEELAPMGELYKWVVYITGEALQEAGYDKANERLKRTGMVIGSLAQTTREQTDVMQPYLQVTYNKKIRSILDNTGFRYQYVMENESQSLDCLMADTEPVRYTARKRGLGGPLVMLNAACASPLYAMGLACYYLADHRADMMIAGAHCNNESKSVGYGVFDTFGVLCGAGESRPLDSNTKGLVTSSGAGAFLLKRLADAERDGDKILAVIESIGWSNDGGSGAGIMSPSVAGQLEAYESAYGNNLSNKIDYIECHATGTVAGDQTEIESIRRYFGASPLVGALKGSTGHFFTASTCAAVAKVIMAMEHGIIPATVGISDPACEGIVRENTTWPKGPLPRRAGINAFGFGGINSHLVLREHNPPNREVSSKTVANPTKVKTAETELAIVGMGMHIGGFRSVEEFLQGLITGGTGFTQASDSRWRGFGRDMECLDALGFSEMPKGAYINSFEFDTMRYKIPVTGSPYFIRRDMLILETVGEALDDAGIKKGECPRTAVLTHCATDYSEHLFFSSEEFRGNLADSLRQTCPELTPAQQEEVLSILRDDEKSIENPDTGPGVIASIRGCRIAAHWGFTGPTFTVYDELRSVFR